MNINVHEEIMAEGKTMVGVIEGDAVPQLFIPELVEYYKKKECFHLINWSSSMISLKLMMHLKIQKKGVAIKPILKIS